MGTIGIIQVAQPALAVGWSFAAPRRGDPRRPRCRGWCWSLVGLGRVHARQPATGAAASRYAWRRPTRGAHGTSGLRGWLPPPTREPDPGNAGGGDRMTTCVPSSDKHGLVGARSPSRHGCTSDTVVVITGAAPLDRGRSPRPPDAVLIAADGGLDHALAAGLEPGVLVGDLDSISAARPGLGVGAHRGRAPPGRQGGDRHRAGGRPRGRATARSGSCSSPATATASTTPWPPSARSARPAGRRSGASRRGGATTSCTSSTGPARRSSTCPPARRSRCSRCTARAPASRVDGRPLAAARRHRSRRSSASASATRSPRRRSTVVGASRAS